MIMNQEKGKWYSPALIERAMALAEELGHARAGILLGIHRDVIGKWMRRKRDGRYMSKTDTPEKKELGLANREIQKLKKENKELKQANTILKELASVFSKDHPNSNLVGSLNSTNKKNQK